MSLMAIKRLFLVAALYDIVLGIIFAVMFTPLYNAFGAALPDNDGYIQLLALLIFIFGVVFFIIHRDPVPYRQFIITGIMMKISFILVVFGHLVFDTIPIPQIYVPLAVIDLLFTIFFAVSCARLNKLAVVAVKK